MRRGEQALKKEREALQERAAALSAAKQGEHVEALCLLEESIALKAQANELRQVGEVPSVGAGGEFLPTHEGNETTYSLAEQEVLLHPDAVNIGASAERLRLLETAGLSELGVDAAESMQAQNSNEQMLIHQMALCHTKAFETISQASEQRDTVDQVRLLNAGARLMDVFQKGMVTLHKMRTGGTQKVFVQHQHVNVNEGGQAVVAGTMKGRGDSGGR